MNRPTHPRMSRRQLLQIGGISALGLGLPQLLQARPPTSTGRGAGRSCIFICLYGGPSQIDMWDMKPAAPPEEMMRPCLTRARPPRCIRPRHFSSCARGQWFRGHLVQSKLRNIPLQSFIRFTPPF